VEKLQFPAKAAMIALLRLFQSDQMLLKLLLAFKSRSVEPLELPLRLIAEVEG
jgi:hypothetical protein